MPVRRLVTSMLPTTQKRRFKSFVARQLNINPAAHLDTTCGLPYKILVGTHHKTGTVWLKTIFETIAWEYALRFVVGIQDEVPAAYDVFFHPHSSFQLDRLEGPFRGLHIIRDPRDVIISGCFYHQKSVESWLHASRDDLGGRSYQDTMNSYATLEDKIAFEMEQVGRATISEMIAWDYTLPSFYELKYEDLIQDVDLALFHKVFSFLGFPGPFLPGALAIAYRRSLFSGQVDQATHVRAAGPAQWKQYFTARHKERFLELFGDLLIRLGYEQDHGWATKD